MNEVKNNVYVVKEIDAKPAREIVKKYHYSGKVVSNSDIHLGVFRDSILVGCLQFGSSMNKKKTPKKIVEGSDGEDMRELNRMVMADSEPRNSESMAISLCFKWLKRFRKDIKWLLSFSDGKEENVGYIYQATNWNYIGYLLSDSFYELDKNIVHNVTVWHRYKEKHVDRDVKTTDEILFDNFSNVSKITSKQHVYVYALNKYVPFLHQRKPYPKKDKEVAVLSRKWLKRDGVVCSPYITEKFTEEELKGIF